MADGGGLRATLELLLHFHGFRNIDLRSRGQYCVEVVAFPVSCPTPPGVPVRTFCDASARRSATRGIAVSPCEGDVEQGGTSCTSQCGLPAYASSVLPIRFTNEQVQLNEGCLFRLNIDSDWVETEVVAIECRLMNRALPEGGDALAPTEEGDASSRNKTPEGDLKEVGKVTLHGKCAAARGGLHRYHPLVFAQPHLCQVDITLHMVLTAMNHPSGPAGLSGAISATAFPSEDSAALPAPRPYNSPARTYIPAVTPSKDRRHTRSASAGRVLENGSAEIRKGVAVTTPLRPRFLTPGRSRSRSIARRGRSASFGAGVASLSPAQAPPPCRQHRMPLSKAALEEASTAKGLCAALGYAPSTLDGRSGEDERMAREVYRAAELLYSRHALGLRWSRGALEVSKSAAMATEAEGTVKVSSKSSTTVLAVKRRNKRKGLGRGGRAKSLHGKCASLPKVSAEAENARASRDGEDGGVVAGKSKADSDGFLEIRQASAAVKNVWDGGDRNRAALNMWGQDNEEAEEEQDEADAMARAAANFGDGRKGGARQGPPPPACEEMVKVHDAEADADAVTEAPSDATPKSDANGSAETAQDFKAVAGADKGEGGEEGGGSTEGHGTGLNGGAKAKSEADMVSWTWGENYPKVKVDKPKKVLPSDVRQLSWVIHMRLTEESTACARAWSAFARATFECGRRGLSRMKEEWVRDSSRAWSGQCLETMSVERDDLLRLNKTLLDPEGFGQLRVRAGVRLKRRASPPGRRSRGARARQRRKNSSFAASAPASASVSAGAGQDTELRLPNGLAHLQALEKALSGSGSGSWIDGAGGGIVAASSSSSSGLSSCSSATSLSAAVAAATTVVNDGERYNDNEDGGEDDEPPLLDALERRVDDDAQRCAAVLEALAATPRKRSSSLVMSWGSVSPWTYGGGDPPGGSRTEQGTGWLSRLAAGKGSAASSPTNSASGANGSQWSDNGKESGGGAGARTEVTAADYPPHPQSLVPVFDRELHGFDPTAPEDDKWGELPFLVVESWGGLDDEFLTAPCSPIMVGHETRSRSARSRHQSRSPTKKTQPLPPLPPLPPSLLATPLSMAGTNGSSVSSSPSTDDNAPTEEAGSKDGALKAAGKGEKKTEAENGENKAPDATCNSIVAAAESAATSAPPNTGPPPLVPPRARPMSFDVFIPSGTRSAGASLSPTNSSRSFGKRLSGSPPGSGKPRSIWDQPPTGRVQPRGPKYCAARRRLHRPSASLSLPPSGAGGRSGVSGGAGAGGFSDRDRRDSSDSVSVASVRSVDYYEDDDDDEDLWSGSDNFSSGSERRRNERRRGREAAKRRSAKRAEIQRRMWGRRPSWTTALLVPPASSASGSGHAGGAADGRAAGAAARPKIESGTNHLIVFVHGLGGRPADLSLMRGYLQTLMPAAELMVATSLQDMRKDNLGVEDMGGKLAEEVHAHVMRFCPFLCSSTGTAPAAEPAANGGPLPLSPVTPMRPLRDDKHAVGGAGSGAGSDVGGGAGGKLSTPLRNRSAGGSPAATRGGVHASPGAAAAARAISEEIVAAGEKITVTPSRPQRKQGKGASTGDDGNGGDGLVARSALLEEAMVPYLPHLQCFVTLACPHLGQTSTPLSFFKTGAWAMRKLTGLRVLHELDLDDAEDVRETTLYKLSLSPGLERFRTIVFAANPRDGFVPLHSASVRCPPESSSSGNGSNSNNGGGNNSSSNSTKKSGKGKTDAVAREMAHMLMSKVDERANRVVRMTLDAPRRRQAQGALDSVIGRAGHMCFIDSAQVAWLISLALLPFLEEQGA